jgi:nucleoside-diphosphate-sugar epimerase
MYELKNKRVLVAGGGGFIGGWLIRQLISIGCSSIRSVDIKPITEWHAVFDDVENLVLDLSTIEHCNLAVKDCDVVFNLAADMGGMGFIENNKALCMLSVLINTHLLQAAKNLGGARFFFASSACVYRSDLQESTSIPGLKEGDAYPASPEDGYGWEKLFSERMCRHFYEDFGIETRIARYHNVYGPFGTFDGGREKAPAAICRKVADALISNDKQISIWGDGNQTRSFTYIDDTITGTIKLMESNIRNPLNIGSSEMVSINQLVSIVEDIAGVKLERNYDLSAPKGVRGRNSDNSLILSELGWEPSISLYEGLEKTFSWIYSQRKLVH